MNKIIRSQAYNPYLPENVYVPDGEPHVFGDRVYVFGSHDKEAGDTYCALPYEFWSAPVDDMTNWTCPGISYEPSQDPLYDAKVNNALYAPDVVQGNDGRYYLYYCMAGHKGKGGYGNPISVAVCDTPDGKYEYLGVVRNPDGTPFMKYANFDPAVINDNGIIRLYSGTWYPMAEMKGAILEMILARVEAKVFGKPKKHIKELRKAGDEIYGPHHMELSDDMMTLASEPVRIIPLDRSGTPYNTENGHGFFEGSSIRKVGDKYYFVYSSLNNHELCYATSDYPDRDFVYGGTIVSNGDIGFNGREKKDRLNTTGTTHGGIECINGQWYVFYHRLTHKSDYSRQGCAEKIYFAEDGKIPQVEITSCGLNGGPLKSEGEYPAVICCNLTNGRMPHSGNKKQKGDIPYIGSGNGEQFIRNISDGTWIGYKYFQMENVSTIKIVYRGNANGTIEVCDSINGQPVGKVKVEPVQTWSTLHIPISELNGIKPLYLHYVGADTMELKSICF